MGRPQPFEGTETINDADGMVSNFWRAIQADPETTAEFADWPVNENDLHARHIWLKGQRETLTAKLEGDPAYYDAKIAGWWVWGCACWIGSGWCDESEGPWSVVDGQLVHLGNAGQGVNRQRVHLGNAGRGVNRKRVELMEYFRQLSDRLRGVRVCSGDWKRICGPTPTVKQGRTGIILDPPYAHSERNDDLYAVEADIATEVREWCKEWTNDKRMRIALCGYEGEGHEELEAIGWECVKWKARGGFSSQGNGDGKENPERERLWFSPSCVKPSKQRSLSFIEHEALYPSYPELANGRSH